MYNLKQHEIDDIKEFLELSCGLDDEIFNNYFVNLGCDIQNIYNNYVSKELSYNENVRGRIATLEEFTKATELKLNDRFYSEINRYIKFSDGCIYYINDNTMLG